MIKALVVVLALCSIVSIKAVCTDNWDDANNADNFFASVDCSGATAADSTCEITLVTGYQGGSVTCVGDAYVAVAAEAITGMCTGNQAGNGDVDCSGQEDNKQNKGADVEGSTVADCCELPDICVAAYVAVADNHFTVDCVGVHKVNEQCSVTPAEGYKNGSVTCAENEDGEGEWTVVSATEITGMCSGNLDVENDVDCTGDLVNKGDDAVGTDEAACCRAKITGRCAGNDEGEDVACTVEPNTVNKGVDVVGTTAEVCCEEPVEGMCEGNTAENTDVDCSAEEVNKYNKGANAEGSTVEACCQAEPLDSAAFQASSSWIALLFSAALFLATRA